MLVGRGGVRLHEEVFLTGVRIRGQAMAEAKVEALLDEALDAPDLTLADPAVRALVAARWNDPDSHLRSRLLTAMSARAQDRQRLVAERLTGRRQADTTRAHEIFGAFRRNLTDSLAALHRAEVEEELMLFSDDQQQQRRRDIRAMEERLTTLAEEERREVAAIEERYADIRPHVSAAAVVFALRHQDVAEGRLG